MLFELEYVGGKMKIPEVLCGSSWIRTQVVIKTGMLS